jgi:hypothetical protein
MGDRTYLHITLHGRIETVEAYNEIVQALDSDGLLPDDYSGSIEGHIIAAAEQGENPGFHNPECNYANIETAESALQDHGVPYYVEHDAGSDYGAGCWSWTPEHGKVDASLADGCPAIDVEDLRKVLNKSKTPVADIAALIESADLASGANLPDFALSDAVRVHLEMAPLDPANAPPPSPPKPSRPRLVEHDRSMTLSPQQLDALVGHDLIYPTALGRYRITQRYVEAHGYSTERAFDYIEGFLAGRDL